MFKLKPTLLADFYKTGHIYQYPEGTEYVYSNFTARSAAHANMPSDWDGKVLFFGLQAMIKNILVDLWQDEFFTRPKDEVVAEYTRRMNTSLGPNVVTPEHIEALWDLGYLPLKIRALPEGSRVPLRVPMFTVINTHPDFFWLTNYFEDMLSAENWKPITVATIASEFRRILNKYVELTGSSPEFADWQLHDFSLRGLSGMHDAGPVGGGHLVGTSGYGTDNIPSLDWLEYYYHANASTSMLGGGVPATEHSVMCAGGKETEKETFLRLMKDVYPSGIVSIVSDTWDFWWVITQLAKDLKEEILSRTPDALGMAKVVFRPDSGDPVEIVAGQRVYTPTDDLWEDSIALDSGMYDVVYIKDTGKYHEFEVPCNIYDDSWPGMWRLGKEVPEHIVKGAVECLWDIFGGDTTEKGYKTLNQRVGLIYGDSITLQRMEQILHRLADKGFSAGNVVYGIGSYTYQHITRDTFGMAMKATWAQVNGEARELFKDPKTDGGTKKSAKGLLRVVEENGTYVLKEQQAVAGLDAMKVVFKDGVIYGEVFETIRQRARQSLAKS